MSSLAEQRVKAVALLLTAILVLQVLWGLGAWLMMSQPDPVLPAPDSLTVVGIDRSALDVDGTEGVSMVSRPLFWPGREPYVPPEGVEEVVAVAQKGGRTSLDKSRLLGVYSAGERRGIILEHQGERLRLMMDEMIDGWTLAMLSADGAIFDKDGDSRTLRMEHAVPDPARQAKPVARKLRENRENSRSTQPDTNETGS